MSGMIILLSVLYTLGLVASFTVCFLKGKPIAGIVGFAGWVFPSLMMLGYLPGRPANLTMCLENQLYGLHGGTPGLCGDSLYWLLLLFVTGPIWVTFAVIAFVGAIQWAKPDSRWAKVFYAKDDMALARRQFPDASVPAEKG